jgi:hypothetical protein
VRAWCQVGRAEGGRAKGFVSVVSVGSGGGGGAGWRLVRVVVGLGSDDLWVASVARTGASLVAL